MGMLTGGGLLVWASGTIGWQRPLTEVSALMSLLEGYSNHVMNAAGARILPSFADSILPPSSG